MSLFFDHGDGEGLQREGKAFRRLGATTCLSWVMVVGLLVMSAQAKSPPVKVTLQWSAQLGSTSLGQEDKAEAAYDVTSTSYTLIAEAR